LYILDNCIFSFISITDDTFYFCILDVNGEMLSTTEKDNIVSTDVQNKDFDADITDIPIHCGEYMIKIFSPIAD